MALQYESLVAVMEKLPNRRNSVQSVAEAVWQVMMEPRFRKSRPNELTGQSARYMKAIQDSVAHGEPVRFVIVLFPFKVWRNPLKTNRRTPDLGELAVLNQLASMHYAIRLKYAPGAIWTVLTEGEAYQDLFGIPHDEVRTYHSGISRFVTLLDEEDRFEFLPLSEVMSGYSDFWKHHAIRRRQIEEALRSGIPEAFQDYYWTFLTSQDVRQVDPATLERIYGSGKKQRSSADGELSLADQEIFRRLDQEARRMMVWYLAYNQAKHDVGQGGAIPTTFPGHLYVSVTSKPGRYTIHPINEKARLFPHHGVPVVSDRCPLSVQWLLGVRSKPERLKPVYVQGDPEDQPFYYAETP